MTYLGSGDPARRRNDWLMAEHFAGTPYGRLYASPEQAAAGQSGGSHVSR
jgi:hypothetical protein